jgi:hypothetical protein
MRPRIGGAWVAQGGIYVGIAPGRDGAPDYHLIAGPEIAARSTWDDAVQWAASLRVNDLSDFALPTRKEQALCFANIPELFKGAPYWSGEQHASNSEDAWGQYFGNGTQDSWGKDYKLRARAVRRLTNADLEKSEADYAALPGTHPDLSCAKPIKETEDSVAWIQQKMRSFRADFGMTHFRATIEGDVLWLDGWRTRPYKEAPFVAGVRELPVDWHDFRR